MLTDLQSVIEKWAAELARRGIESGSVRLRRGGIGLASTGCFALGGGAAQKAALIAERGTEIENWRVTAQNGYLDLIPEKVWLIGAAMEEAKKAPVDIVLPTSDGAPDFGRICRAAFLTRIRPQKEIADARDEGLLWLLAKAGIEGQTPRQRDAWLCEMMRLTEKAEKLSLKELIRDPDGAALAAIGQAAARMLNRDQKKNTGCGLS